MKYLSFGDIHFGKKRNSILHNQDCIDYIIWMLDVAKEEGIKNIVFCGDWHDNPSEINTVTLNYSQAGLELLDQCEWIDKVYFLVGNHDLANRNNRDITSLPHTRPFEKIQLINEPTKIGNILFTPFLFKHEYDLLKDTTAKYVYGHFEFNGFVMAGGGYVMDNGADPRYYSKPDYIISGHFHARQVKSNIIYQGSTFPMDFSDVGDVNRGCCILDTAKRGDNRIKFMNWEDGPSYVRCALSELLENPDAYLKSKAYVECDVDISITYLESVELQKQLITDYDLRMFKTKDRIGTERDESIGQDVEIAENEEVQMNDTGTMVLNMLSDVKAESINNDKLKDLFLRI